ncbi:MAG: hypothetical protein Q8J64_01795 [Thermodesulfovibrionales bacterium]|nr:hypothetical protein [Thermodesulfovibrionales bacterium]
MDSPDKPENDERENLPSPLFVKEGKNGRPQEEILSPFGKGGWRGILRIKRG